MVVWESVEFSGTEFWSPFDVVLEFLSGSNVDLPLWLSILYCNSSWSLLSSSVESANSLLAHFQNDLHRRNEDLEEKTCFYSITVDKNTQYSIPVGNRTKLSQGQEYSSYSEQLCYPALSLQTTLKKVSKVQLLTQSFERIPAKNWTRIMKNAGNRVSRLGAKSGMESQGNLPIPPTDRPN